MRTALILFLSAVTVALNAQTYSLLESIKCDQPVDLILSMDWKELERKKMDKAYYPAKAELITPRDSIRIDVKARARGNMRLTLCSYPPLKIKVDKKALQDLQLKAHNEFDVVHHCHKGEQFDQFILREYLAYKLYQQISPVSYNVQLVRIHYLNPDGTVEAETSVGFMVENTEELVDRVGAKRTKVPVISQNAIDRTSLLRVCMFQYMIGNTDWFITNRHNLEFIGVPGIPFLVTVPYDFDYSGLVGTPYASHHESIKLMSTHIRYYQGRCEPEENVMKIVNEFISKKNILLDLPKTIPGLSEQSLKYVTSYLEDFFEVIENPKKLESNILRHCDMWPRDN